MSIQNGQFNLQLVIDPVLWGRRLSLFGSAVALIGAAFYTGWRHGCPDDVVSIPIDNVIQNQQIEEILSKFDLDDEQLSMVMGCLEEQIEMGLNPETANNSDLKMIPSFVRYLPTGREEGKVIAIDLGGTNFRVIEVDLLRDSQIQTNSKMFVVPENIMTGTGEELFQYLAASISNFMKANQLAKRTVTYPCGFTFSFPCEQLALNSAKLIQWTKSYSCSDCVGNDVVQMLCTALQKRRDIKLDVKALINDTVGTLINCAHSHPDCKIGVIFGTGTNACYVEDLDKVKTWTGDRNEPKQVIINTEWGAFGDNGCLDSILTEYDEEVDQKSTHPKSQRFEKMISGMYMGELARLVVRDLIEKKLIFQGSLEGMSKSENDEDHIHFVKSGSFYTKFVSEIESDEGVAFARAKQLIEEFGITQPSYADCMVLKQICERLSRRGALLASAAIATLINRIDEPTVTVGIDGSLYKCHPNFKKNMQAGLTKLVVRRIKYQTVLSNDGSGRGAAVCAAVQHDIDSRVRRRTEFNLSTQRNEIKQESSMNRSTSEPQMQ